MKYKNFNIIGKTGKSNCVVRSFCKLYDKEYDDVFNQLIVLAEELNCQNYNDIKVFEKVIYATFVSNNNFFPSWSKKNIFPFIKHII